MDITAELLRETVLMIFNVDFYKLLNGADGETRTLTPRGTRT
jgi:hypothetical protein